MRASNVSRSAYAYMNALCTCCMNMYMYMPSITRQIRVYCFSAAKPSTCVSACHASHIHGMYMYAVCVCARMSIPNALFASARTQLSPSTTNRHITQHARVSWLKLARVLLRVSRLKPRLKLVSGSGASGTPTGELCTRIGKHKAFEFQRPSFRTQRLVFLHCLHDSLFHLLILKEVQTKCCPAT